MEKMIFNESDESRAKCDLNFMYSNSWLRSVYTRLSSDVAGLNGGVGVLVIQFDSYILPVCTI